MIGRKSSKRKFTKRKYTRKRYIRKKHGKTRKNKSKRRYKRGGSGGMDDSKIFNMTLNSSDRTPELWSKGWGGTEGSYPYMHWMQAEGIEGVSAGYKLIKIGENDAPETWDKAKTLIERIKTQGQVVLKFLKSITSPEYNNNTITRYYEGKLIDELRCPPSNYIQGITKGTIDTITFPPKNNNLGEDDDHFALNPRQNGFDGIPGEVLFIPPDYIFYKGASKDDPASRFPCDYSLDYPQWYSDKSIADKYSGDQKQMMVYKTKRTLVLLNLLDLPNIEWMNERLDTVSIQMDSNWKEVMNIGEAENPEYLKKTLNAVTRQTRYMGQPLSFDIHELRGDDGRSISSETLNRYITFCGKKYGKQDAETFDVVNRGILWDDDKKLPHILLTVLKDIRCDGYFIDSTPSMGHGIFPREIMLLHPAECLEIDTNNDLHTCKEPGPAPGTESGE